MVWTSSLYKTHALTPFSKTAMPIHSLMLSTALHHEDIYTARLSNKGKCRFDIIDEVITILDAARKTDEPIANTKPLPLS